jgi:hypothetical protein
LVTAWSRAENVSGTPDDGYSIYVDLQYVDGDHLWGSIARFDCGSHGWQERSLRVLPTKPVQEAYVYLLLRRHTGRVWFSDASINLDPKPTFDFQEVDAPQNVSGGQWFIRDFAGHSKVTPLADCATLGLRAETAVSGDSHTIRVYDLQGHDRALTLYYCEMFNATGGEWWNTIRTAAPIGITECATTANVTSGADGLASTYPFGAVTTSGAGHMLAVPPTMGPRIVRIFYHPTSKLLCAAFDVALVRANRVHPGEADAEVMSLPVDPAWGFRDAARRYYAAFPDAFRSRMPKQGIWIPFTDPATVAHPEDFGIAVHEGDNSVQSDARLGILSFRYTEPMTWWMPMDPATPRTYDAAVQLLNQALQGPDPNARRRAQAVLSSGDIEADGRYNVYFRNEPWTNGAVWVLNPNPALTRQNGEARQADLDFDPGEAAKRYADNPLSGEYLDSLESNSEVLDYRPESLAASTLCPSFDSNGRPVIPQAYSTYEIALSMSTWLHANGKLLIANATPSSYYGYMPLLDCAGIEVNWMPGGAWTPDGDDRFCYRRTLCYHKPYMLMQNTDFSKFGPDQVRLYFKKCLFYGVYPSFFSADADTHPYWEDPALYNRDREAFTATVPLIRTLSEAGWEPVTEARTDDPAVLIERYGESTWTLFNDSATPRSFHVTVDFKGKFKAKDLATGEAIKVTLSAGKATFGTTLEPGDCRVVRLERSGVG